MARRVSEMREGIGEAEADSLLETSGVGSEAEFEGERGELADSARRLTMRTTFWTDWLAGRK